MAKKAEEKKKPGRPKRVMTRPESAQANPLHGVKTATQPSPVEPDVEDVSEQEAEAMVERHVHKKEEVKAKLEESVDAQDWTQSDPVIPEDLIGRVWIAVFRCPEGHKTKATNRQAKSGVRCYICKGAGKEVKADIMAQFLVKPEPLDEDLEKRRKARKGAE